MIKAFPVRFDELAERQGVDLSKSKFLSDSFRFSDLLQFSEKASQVSPGNVIEKTSENQGHKENEPRAYGKRNVARFLFQSSA